MPIDINLLREDRGGNPELVRESQRRRFASVELVDQVRVWIKRARVYACTYAWEGPVTSAACRPPAGSMSRDGGGSVPRAGMV